MKINIAACLGLGLVVGLMVAFISALAVGPQTTSPNTLGLVAGSLVFIVALIVASGVNTKPRN